MGTGFFVRIFPCAVFFVFQNWPKNLLTFFPSDIILRTECKIITKSKNLILTEAKFFHGDQLIAKGTHTRYWGNNWMLKYVDKF